MPLSRDQWNVIATKVIELLEGGYYHPSMFMDGRLDTKYLPLYQNSGETMFGLDRHAGHSLFYINPRKSSDVKTNLIYIPGYIYKTNTARQFWSIIDNAKAKNNWPWNYKGGQHESELRSLAASLMFETYQNYANKYLTEKAKNIVESDPGLLMNFAWATWNGPGFFQYYSDRINQKVQQGETDPSILNADTLSARLNSKYPTIRDGGKKIKDYLLSIKFRELASKFAAPAFEGIAILVGFFLIYKFIKQ